MNEHLPLINSWCKEIFKANIPKFQTEASWNVLVRTLLWTNLKKNTFSSANRSTPCTKHIRNETLPDLYAFICTYHKGYRIYAKPTMTLSCACLCEIRSSLWRVHASTGHHLNDNYHESMTYRNLTEFLWIKTSENC